MTKTAKTLNDLLEKLSGSPFYIPVKFKGLFQVIVNPDLKELEAWKRNTSDVNLLKNRKYSLLNYVGEFVVTKSSPERYSVCDAEAFSSEFIACSPWELKHSSKDELLDTNYVAAKIFLQNTSAEVRFYKRYVV